MTDPQLFLEAPPTVPLARKSDPLPAKIAAARQTPKRLARGRWLVLDDLEHHGPSTDHEIAARTGMVLSSAGKRRGDLVRLGWIAATHDHRLSPTGTPATVWTITADGHLNWSTIAARGLYEGAEDDGS